MKFTHYLSALVPLALVLLFTGNTALAQDKTRTKIPASSIQILAVQTNEVNLPIEFQLALYDNPIEQMHQANKFQHVHRDGDTSDANATVHVILNTTVSTM